MASTVPSAVGSRSPSIGEIHHQGRAPGSFRATIPAVGVQVIKFPQNEARAEKQKVKALSLSKETDSKAEVQHPEGLHVREPQRRVRGQPLSKLEMGAAETYRYLPLSRYGSEHKLCSAYRMGSTFTVLSCGCYEGK